MLWGRDGFEEFVEYLNGVTIISTHAYTIGSLMTYSGRISVLSKAEKVVRSKGNRGQGSEPSGR